MGVYPLHILQISSDFDHSSSRLEFCQQYIKSVQRFNICPGVFRKLYYYLTLTGSPAPSHYLTLVIFRPVLSVLHSSSASREMLFIYQCDINSVIGGHLKKITQKEKKCPM